MQNCRFQAIASLALFAAVVSPSIAFGQSRGSVDQADGEEDAQITPDFANLREEALQGDLSAQIRLAVNYRQGLGVSIDHDEAFRFYNLAAGQGDLSSRWFAMMYRFVGKGLNPEQSHSWGTPINDSCPSEYIERPASGLAGLPDRLNYFVVRVDDAGEGDRKVDYLATISAKIETEQPLATCYVPSQRSNINHKYLQPTSMSEPPRNFGNEPYNHKPICLNNYTNEFYDPWSADYIGVSEDGYSLGNQRYDYEPPERVADYFVIQDKSGIGSLVSLDQWAPSKQNYKFIKENRIDSDGIWRGETIGLGGFRFRTVKSAQGDGYSDYILFSKHETGYQCTYRAPDAPVFDF